MEHRDIRRVTVIGAGLMGSGIALEFALAGFEVGLQDLDEARVAKAREAMRANLHLYTEVGLVTQARAEELVAAVRLTTSLEEAAAGADLVIEAVFEDLELKLRVFRELDRTCRPEAILASNSSTLLPSLLAAATGRPDRVLIAHYFNPPYLLPLVELVRHPGTSDATVDTMFALMTRIGKKPAVVRKEVPGFIGNRLQAALFREAIHLVEEGIASPADVDTVVREGFGRRLAAAGPFEVWELAGWDLILSITKNVNPSLDSSVTTSRLLGEMVSGGRLGTKAGRGFYEWTPEAVEGLRKRIGETLAALAKLR